MCVLCVLVIMCSHHSCAGPAAYMLPSVLGPGTVSKTAAPNYSLCGRSKVGSFHEDLQKVGSFIFVVFYNVLFDSMYSKMLSIFHGR